MRKSRRWSDKDIRKIGRIIKTAKAEGFSTRRGIVRAASEFGVTPNAINIQYGRKIKKHVKKTGANRISNRILKIQAAAYKKAWTPKKEQTKSRSIIFDIKEVSIDIETKKMTITY